MQCNNIVNVFDPILHISRPISKEEKEKENKNKSSPIKPNGRAVPGQVHFVDNRLCDGVTNRLYSVRHHLERTTGPGMI